MKRCYKVEREVFLLYEKVRSMAQVAKKVGLAQSTVWKIISNPKYYHPEDDESLSQETKESLVRINSYQESMDERNAELTEKEKKNAWQSAVPDELREKDVRLAKALMGIGDRGLFALSLLWKLAVDEKSGTIKDQKLFHIFLSKVRVPDILAAQEGARFFLDPNKVSGQELEDLLADVQMMIMDFISPERRAEAVARLKISLNKLKMNREVLKYSVSNPKKPAPTMDGDMNRLPAVVNAGKDGLISAVKLRGKTGRQRKEADKGDVLDGESRTVDKGKRKK